MATLFRYEGASGNGPADDRALAAVLRRHPGRIALAAEMLEPSDARRLARLREDLAALPPGGR